MCDVEREMVEKELGHLALAILEGIHGADGLDFIVESKATYTLQLIRNALDDERRDDFECIEEIIQILWGAGITTSRHDFG